jgi:hypothetical protein
MVSENAVFYIVLFTLLTVVLNALLTKSQRRHENKYGLKKAK